MVAALPVALVGCGGGSDDEGSAPDGVVTTDTVPAVPTPDPTATTPPPTTTTTTTTGPTEILAAVDDGPLAPLTGAPVPEGTDLDRPALAVKIDNHRLARPQTGLDQADLVFDLRAEGITRFMAVFHSHQPDTVGPVRSSRTSDFDLLRGLDHPIYASSGGNANVMAGVAALPVHALTNHTRREYFRQSGRPAPHNLFVHPADLAALVSAERAPEPWFRYRVADQDLSPRAEEATSATVNFTDSPTVDLVWSPEREGWLRSQDGNPHLTSDGDQLAPPNVVIMVTTYGVSSADANSPEVRSVGTGPVVVLTDGYVVTGTWHRATANDKPLLVDGDGVEIALTPGQAWVMYPEKGQVVVDGAPVG